MIRINPYFVIAILAVVVYFANIHGLPIYVLDEAKNARCAAEMYESQEWIIPTFNGELRTDKPPFHYYIMIGGYHLFGVSPLGARVGSAFFGVLTVLLLFFMVRKALGLRAGLTSALVFLASIQMSVQFRLAVPDPYLIFFFTAAMGSFYFWHISNSRVYLFALYTALGFGFLTKGPVAILLPVLISGLFWLFDKSFTWTKIKQNLYLPGILVFLIVALPWYIAVGFATDWIWVEDFFLKHNLSRYSEPMEGHGGSPLLIPVFIILGMLPFSLVFPQAFVHAWKNRGEKFILLSLIVVAVVAVFFSFSGTKLPTYPEPAFPFFAAIVGFWFSRLHDPQFLKRSKVWINFLIFIAIFLSATIFGYLFLLGDPHYSIISGEVWFSLILPIGIGIAWIFVYRGKIIKAAYSMILASILFTVLAYYIILPKLQDYNPVENSKALLADAPKAYYRIFNPAFVFYHGNFVRLEKEDDFSSFWEHFPDGKIVTREKYLSDLQGPFEVLFKQKDLFENNVTVILGKPDSEID